MSESKRYPHLFTREEVEQNAFSFSHPWNENSQISGTHLSQLGGLKHSGVSIARVPPGKDSFVYHRHHREEGNGDSGHRHRHHHRRHEGGRSATPTSQYDLADILPTPPSKERKRHHRHHGSRSPHGSRSSFDSLQKFS